MTNYNQEKKLSVFHVIAGLQPRSGGPSRTVVQLGDALADATRVNISLITQGLSGDSSVASRSINVDRCVQQTTSRFALVLGLPVLQELANKIRGQVPSIIHSHGLWLPVNHWASRAARRRGIPFVVHPRGMLEPWAMSQKAWKKRLAMTIFQRRDLESAALLIATSEAEYQSIRMLGFTQPVAVIPNGIQPNEMDDKGPQHEGENRVRNALFLSRIHPSKGLLNLITAWGQLRPAGWRLRIVGPDENGHLAEVIAASRAYGVEDFIDFVGEVDDGRKSAIYRDADVFILPTFSENFGLVVTEALAHGLPVITTRGAPWADLEEYGCGWWIDIGVGPLVDALRDAIRLNDAERMAMGARGRSYVRRYDWNAIAKQTVAAYRWILNEGPKPDHVQVD